MKSSLVKIATNLNFDWLNRYVGNYDSEDKALLTNIESIYSKILKGNFYWHLHKTEATNEGKPISILCFELDYSYWNQKLGSNPLLEIVEEIFAQICCFQKLRLDTRRSILTKNIGQVDKINDPISLLLEEIKAWLERKVTTYDLSKSSDCKELKIEIHKRGEYFTALIDTKLLSAFDDKFLDKKPINVEQLLNEITRILTKNAIEIINLELSRQSSSQKFNELRHHVTRILKHGFRYGFFAFQDITNLDSNFTIQEIRHPRLDATKTLLNTDAGKLTRILLTTNLMQDIFPDHADFLTTYSTITTTQNENEHNAIVNLSNKQEESYLYNPDNLLKISYFMKANANKAPIDLWIESSNSGFYKKILTNLTKPEDKVKFIRNFANFYAALMKLASYYTLIESAFNIASEGGNIFVYGYAGKFFKVMMEQLEFDLNNLETCIVELNKVGDHMKQMGLYNHADTNKSWTQNYSYAQTSFNELTRNSLKSAAETVTEIKNKIISFNMQDKLKNLQQEFVGFVKKLGLLVNATNSNQSGSFNLLLTNSAFNGSLLLTNTSAQQTNSVEFAPLNAQVDSTLSKADAIEEEEALLLLYKISQVLKTLDTADNDVKRRKMLFNSARIHHRIANFDSALAKYNQVLEGLNPNDITYDAVRITLGCLLYELGQYYPAYGVFNHLNNRVDKSHINIEKLAEYLGKCSEKITSATAVTVINSQTLTAPSATSQAAAFANSNATSSSATINKNTL